MSSNQSITRRGWARRLIFGVGGAAFAAVSRKLGAAGLQHGGRLTWDIDTTQRDTVSQRRYRADAQVLLLGLPLLHRTAVGAGSAVWKESATEGGKIRFLEFTGFSKPDRAAGLNRLGFIREMSRYDSRGVTESIYFGLMTSSPEESADQARQALHSHATEVTYSVVEGRIAPDSAETVGAQFTAPARMSVDNRGELVEMARAAIDSSKNASETKAPGLEARPFLESLADLLRQPDRVETRYVYSGRWYHLSVNRSADAKATMYFREHGSIAKGASVVRASGKLRRESGGNETNFRLWFEPEAAMPIPLRIEYQPKSFLRLVFEAEA
jgi:hypothetical protein